MCPSSADQRLSLIVTVAAWCSAQQWPPLLQNSHDDHTCASRRAGGRGAV